LRQRLGKDDQGRNVADVLLFQTFEHLDRPLAGPQVRVDFVKKILEQSQKSNGNRFDAVIREVFQGRGLAL
jgi:hypothetical protein